MWKGERGGFHERGCHSPLSFLVLASMEEENINISLFYDSNDSPACLSFHSFPSCLLVSPHNSFSLFRSLSFALSILVPDQAGKESRRGEGKREKVGRRCRSG